MMSEQDGHEELASYEELKQALESGADVDATEENERTALMTAMVAKDLRKAKLLIEHGADVELADSHNRTALRDAVEYDFLEGVRLLLSLNAERGYHPKYPLKKIDFDAEYFIHIEEIEMPDSFKEFMSEEEWKEQNQETIEMLIEMGQNPTIEPMIVNVYNVEILKLFLEAGDDLNLASNDMKRAFIGIDDEYDFQSTPKEYQRNKSPRYGTCNPDRMDNPFWKDMVTNGFNTFAAREHFDDPVSLKEPSVVWCYDRFGSSLTPLDDGHFVQIGGEHEDHYDPDFCIYNDVVIHDGNGSFEIYGYPEEVFPPTDFHTATLVDDWIYIIGCIGYMEQKEIGKTPVYRLKLDSWEIESVGTTGAMPSWLCRHRANYDSAKNRICLEAGEIHTVDDDGEIDLIPNKEQYELDLTTFQWQKLNR